MGTKFVKPENYIVIQGFMLTDLHLKSTELLVYAVIYGFCQTEQQYFTGNLKYLAEWTNCTVRGVSKCLKSLTEKNLISDICDENGKRCGYTILATQEQSSANIGTKFREDRNKASDPTGTKFHKRGTKFRKTGTKFHKRGTKFRKTGTKFRP